jgi:two-component sensor histidine kinase
MDNSSSHHQHYLELLGRFSSNLIGKDTVDDVLWAITENAIAELGFEDCVVYLVDDKREFLIQRAAYGPKDKGQHEIVEPIKIPIGIGVVGTVAKTGEAEIVADCSLDPRYIKDDEARNSEISVPIIKDGKVIGVIDSEHSQTGYYNEEHLTLLRTIAHMTALRLSQIRFRSSVEEHRDKLVEEVAETKDELQTAMYQLQQSNAQLEVLLKEKSQLLKELHHRIKNQMQMLHSLINLQSNQTDDDEVKESLLICMNRVRCMGLVYQMAEGLTIDIARYLRTLNDELHSAQGIYPSTAFEVIADNLVLSTEKAVILGFILVDLFTSGVESLQKTEGPTSTIQLEINDHCQIQFLSNWWGFDEVGELTEIFIAQIGAERVDSTTGLHLVCRI